MQLLLSGQVIEMELDRSKVDHFFEFIGSKLNESDLHFSHMVIDGVEVYDDFKDYIEDKAAEIQSIEVQCKSVDLLKTDVLVSATQYINSARPSIERLSEEFYKNPSAETWSRFDQFLEAVAWISQVVEGTFPSGEPAGLNLNQLLAVSIGELQQALINKDTVLIGDLIKYEILKQLAEIDLAIKQTLGKEGIAL